MAGRVSKAKRAVLITCCALLGYLAYYTLTTNNAFQQSVTESLFAPIRRATGLTANTGNNEGPSGDQPEVWVHDKEGDATVSGKRSAGHEDVSCYPRLFAMEEGTKATTLLSSSCNKGRLPQPAESKPRQHVFFLATHKTGSLTVTTILNRYGLLHNLSVAMPRGNSPKPDPTDGPNPSPKPSRLSNYADWSERYPPGPLGALGQYDMVINQPTFNESCVRRYLPEDTVLVSIVREPLQRFVSAFYFRGSDKRVPGPDPVLTYLSDLEHWDSTLLGGMLHCRYIAEYGLDRKQREPQNLPASLQKLSRLFHPVLLTEAFDESMVLLKRKLSWKLPEIMYTKFHEGVPRPAYNFTEKQKLDFENARKEDYVMYRHFRAEFYRAIEAQGESFAEEVRVFQAMRNKVGSFCRSITGRSYGKRQDLMVEGTEFSDPFCMTEADCLLLQKSMGGEDDHWFTKVMRTRLQQ